MHARLNSVVVATTLLVAMLAASGASAATTATEVPSTEPSAETLIPLGTCTGPRTSPAPDGSSRQSFDAVEAQGVVAALPPRTAAEVGLREATQICVGFQNRTGQAVTLELSTSDVGMDSDGAPMSTLDDVEYGAASWLELPTDEIRDLPQGDIAWLLVDVAVPADATAGSWYASIRATIPAQEAGGSGLQITQARTVVTQVFFDIPGDVARGGRVENLRSPRVIWWDGLGLGRLPVLDDVRGLGIAPIRFDWRNTGDYTDVVGGRVAIKSDLGGRAVESLDVEASTVLRGAERAYSVTWSRDIPLVGRFTPTLTMAGSDGRAAEVELDPIWVIPSWWYLLALVLAIALPLWWRRRSKRRYAALEARVEAAEARGQAAPGDEDWDEVSEEWSR